MGESYDVIVVGGGIAGVAAARDLADRGHSVVLLEAGNRLGGRTFAQPFTSLNGVTVDLGGSWVNRKLQPLIRRETQRYNIVVSEDGPTRSSAFYTGGKRRTLLPVPSAELGDLERALGHLRDASKRINAAQLLHEQPIRDLDVSPDEFFAPLNLPVATRDIINAMIAAYSGHDPSGVSMLNIVGQVAGFGYSPYGFVGALTERFVGGTSQLLRRMVEGSRFEVRFDQRVVAIDQSSDAVRAVTASGETVSGRQCIIAVPTNVIRHIEFRPALSADKRWATGRNHVGRLIKPCIHVRNVPAATFALGWSTLQMVCSAHAVGDGSMILYGFGSEGIGELKADDRLSVERALREYYPDAEVIAVQGHDWSSDPLFDGTNRHDRPGDAYRFLTVMNQPDGRVVFAGTDVDASVWRTWMEGALGSAQRAADVVTASLTSECRSAEAPLE
ncbi:flavin monoamine oxidase family protein [Mycobacterium sp. 48b]|uniref:flavin monoamine oxidase family protein n=1 Tax=Mycobacterium sp. 48b TaxID=3400426 RepID=UPI003AAF3FF7